MWKRGRERKRKGKERDGEKRVDGFITTLIYSDSALGYLSHAMLLHHVIQGVTGDMMSCLFTDKTLQQQGSYAGDSFSLKVTRNQHKNQMRSCKHEI